MSSVSDIYQKYQFVDLKRTFHEISTGDNAEADFSQFFGNGKGIQWPDLVKEYRLIILSEAGSGKTEEIRHATRFLRQQGKQAFFLRLEHIPTDFEEAFEIGTYQEFEEWLASGDEGWLLLDSVDEARLQNPRDFERAIRRLSGRIRSAKDRSHIVITGRTTAWRPKTDLELCISQLPFGGSAIAEEDTHDVKKTLGKSSQLQTTKNQEHSGPVFKIVALDDLTSSQIGTFVESRGVSDTRKFLEAVERADAWSFTCRPQDLDELTRFWIDAGRIGSRLEIMRNSIKSRLIERDQTRAEARPFSIERARQGAQLIAAATTLTKDPTIRIPDGADNLKGIPVQAILANWDEREQSIILSRPIFDEAIYGTVRFHHRSVREYLAAEWFSELLKREASRRTIEGLFFRNQYGLEIIVPSLRPVLPWLIIFDERIRERVCKIAPDIIFEGGDPSQLPLEVRRKILREICEKIADGQPGKSVHDYAAVQRFSSLDLTEDVRKLLRQYSNNDELISFLLRMVWIGQLSGALPEALKVAMASGVERYARTAAIRAVNAIGSDEDKSRLRQAFLISEKKLGRDWLAELIEATSATKQTVEWALACLKKIEKQDGYTSGRLSEVMTEFVATAEIDLLPQLLSGLNRLLTSQPLIERQHRSLSAKFQWLITPACKAAERLITSRHAASLTNDVLNILHRLPVALSYAISDLNDLKADFSTLVPGWPELNRALFWFDVRKTRQSLDKQQGGQLTEYWRVSVFGSFWRFDISDFPYVLGEISRQSLLDDKLVALSIAFKLYKDAKSPRTWRTLLMATTSGNDELVQRLNIYLKPPTQSPQDRRWKQQEAQWKKQSEARKKKEEEHHNEWKIFLQENLEKIRGTLITTPGTITNPLTYLFNQIRDKQNSSGRWTSYNWKSLAPEYGEEVAIFYRDSAVSFWRNHILNIRSEGVPVNQTPFGAIFGLVGLEIEATEVKGWPNNFSAEEVELACRYASFELNGFPTWFPRLFETNSRIVIDFLIREIEYELSIEAAGSDISYIINDLSWSGQWAWDEIAPRLYKIVKAKEPGSLRNLDKLLKIIQGSSLPDDLISKLALRKCHTVKKLDHLALWYAVWTGVDPSSAISSFEERIGQLAKAKDRTQFAMSFITHLVGALHGDGVTTRKAFKTPEYLKVLYLLMHKYIRMEEDINRANGGVYSPGLRDNAQDARDTLFSLLNQIPGKAAFIAIMDIAQSSPEKEFCTWMLSHARAKATLDGDSLPWLPEQVRDFNEKLERTPSNHQELAELAVLRLLDLKDDLEHGDSSIAKTLQKVSEETEMRIFIGRELRGKAFGRYSIPQEEELADAKRPDLRFHGNGFDGPVPIELKLSENWTGPVLFERLRNQLCRDYLRDIHSSRGIFVLIHRSGKSRWDLPGGKKRADFEELVAALQSYWGNISPEFPAINDVAVIGIDLTKRLN